MVTVEAAIALGGLVLVLAVVLAGIGAAVARIRCVDAAGEGAVNTGTAVDDDALQPMEDVSSPGSAVPPGLPHDAAPVTDLDSELPPR